MMRVLPAVIRIIGCHGILGKEVWRMRKIVVSVQNGLLAEAITGMLNDSGEFQPFRIPVTNKKSDVLENCEML